MSSTEPKSQLAVVHLVWMPFGPDPLRSFIESYLKHPAGCEHDLVILFNGTSHQEDASAYHSLLREAAVVYESHYLSSGMDIEAYYWIADRLPHRYILFLNSYSRLRAGQWGKYYLEAIGNNAAGAVSATGSWQSYYSTVFMANRFGWERNESFHVNFRKYKLFVKALLYWRILFKPFPNPHLRTNAFIISRELFLAITRPAVLRKKFTAYVYESGKRGLSGQLLKSGYKLLIVDKSGKVYAKEDWKRSGVFWIGGQENLLVSDNQTQSYEEAGPADKRKFTYLAWGK
jgi:hypothetical protein